MQGFRIYIYIHVISKANINGVNVLGLRKSKQSAASSWIAAREWRLGEKIGSGSFGDVFMGLNNKVRTFEKV